MAYMSMNTTIIETLKQISQINAEHRKNAREGDIFTRRFNNTTNQPLDWLSEYRWANYKVIDGEEKFIDTYKTQEVASKDAIQMLKLTGGQHYIENEHGLIRKADTYPDVYGNSNDPRNIKG